MPRRPKAERESTSRGLTPAVRPGESELAAALGDDAESERPDLDEREERQSPERKPAGPGRPSRPAAGPASPTSDSLSGDVDGSDDSDDEDELIESWGREPCAMPPSEPDES